MRNFLPSDDYLSDILVVLTIAGLIAMIVLCATDEPQPECPSATIVKTTAVVNEGKHQKTVNSYDVVCKGGLK
jgi:hypothetical protein